MGPSVSIKDIARAAGVSPSTVSRALHHHPRISEETAVRIRTLAQDLGYSPSLPARSLVTRHTATIGMVITHPSDPFLGRLVLGVEETARSQGYFDDLELAAYCWPPLTTVKLPRYRLGQRAMEMLLSLIAGCTGLEAETLPAELVLRETTGPARTPVGHGEGR